MGKSVHLAAMTRKPSFLTRGIGTRKSLSTLFGFSLRRVRERRRRGRKERKEIPNRACAHADSNRLYIRNAAVVRWLAHTL